MRKGERQNRIIVNGKATIRLGLFAAFVLILAFILPKSYRNSFVYDVGKPWMGADLIAAFDFPIHKTAETLSNEKKEAASTVPAVFTPDTSAQSESVLKFEKRWEKLKREIQEYQRLLLTNPQAAETQKAAILGEFPAKPEQFPLLQDIIPNGAAYFSRIRAFTDKVYSTGLIDYSFEQIHQDVVALRIHVNEEKRVDKYSLYSWPEIAGAYQLENGKVTEAEKVLISAVWVPSLKASFRYNRELTQADILQAQNRLSPVKELIDAGQFLVRNGDEVTAETDILLKSYSLAKAERYGKNRFWAAFLGQLGIVAMVMLLLAVFLRSNRPRIFYRNRKVALILIVMMLMMLIAVLLLLFSRSVAGKAFDANLTYLVPVCMVSLILTSFYDLRVGFFVNILMSILVGILISNGFEYFFVQFCAGTVSVYSVTRLRNRSDFFFSQSYILGAYIFSYFVYSLFSTGYIGSIDYTNFILFGLNVLLTFITYPLIWVFEKMFRMTSELTYVELLDTNHPLLKDLFSRAPGTFHHSMQVANISEAVIRRIGGNSLLAKVGALFHDIGKMENPRFFIENQIDGQNPHEKLSFEKSSEFIIRHVQDGVKLALHHNLPREVIDFIRTHHGTSRVEFFFRRYSAEHKNEEVNENPFRYPGPLPFTRETAVVMIVDSIEAACRAMTSRSREDIKTLIDKIIEHKIQLRQLDHANITFKDLQDIRQVVLEQIMNIYHERIAYPE